ncbi:MAG: outer membrane protein assembly factor BamD [Candidatus Eisenbacteria bacterium]|nr:outer membrane protein assembly factor BamD [Candidatus Eisenbacteria bacterium]
MDSIGARRALGRVVLIAAVLATAAGCSRAPELGEATAADAYEIGRDAADREDYLMAIEAFGHVIDSSPLHELADDALLGLADAHRAIGDYPSAEAEYRQVLEDYPRSPLVPEAEFKLGLSFSEQSLPAALDQSMTEQAIDQLDYFLTKYPDSELTDQARAEMQTLRDRLASKDYDNAMLYLTLEQPQAARVYFEAVARDYPDTSWARLALLQKARSFAAEGSSALAAETYQRVIDLYAETAEAATAAEERSALPDQAAP